MDSQKDASTRSNHSDKNTMAEGLIFDERNLRKECEDILIKKETNDNISNSCELEPHESMSQLESINKDENPEVVSEHIVNKNYDLFCDERDALDEDDDGDHGGKKLKVEEKLDDPSTSLANSVQGVDYTVVKAPSSPHGEVEPSRGRRRRYRKMAKTYYCAQCDFNSPRWDRLKEHLIVHLEDRPFVCEICLFRTKTAKKLKRHQTVHSEERKYECSLCEQTFKRAHTLKEHVLTHSKEKIFFCSECDYSTHRSQYLKRHMMKHTSELLECPLCQFKTVYATLLRRHVQIHSDSKYFKCSMCSYSTVHSHCLTQHIKNIHERDTTYKCGVCNFSTPQPSTLRTHMYVHATGEKKHKCEFCDYSSMRKCDVKRHQSKIHKDRIRQGTDKDM